MRIAGWWRTALHFVGRHEFGTSLALGLAAVAALSFIQTADEVREGEAEARVLWSDVERSKPIRLAMHHVTADGVPNATYG